MGCQDTADLAPLFEPLTVGRTTLRNRIGHPGVIGNLGRSGVVTARQVAYYEARARGGAGLVVTEGMSVHPSSAPNPSVVRVYDEANADGLTNLAAAVHDHGARVLMQLWHVGRQQLWGPSVVPWGVSALPDALSGAVPHVMTAGELAELRDAFVSGAVAAHRYGFDGVEVHAAHGYLVTQTLSPWSNTRDDEYGGDLEGRTRFLREICAGIRAACGPEFVVDVKLSGSEFVEGGLDADDTVAIVDRLARDGLVDLVSTGQGNFSVSLEKHVPDLRFPQAPFAAQIERIRANVDVPVMAIGRVIDPDVAAGLLRSGAADLVGMARSLVSDPDAPNKWRGADPAPVRRCISCNVCWGTIHRGQDITCIHTADVAPSGVSRTPRVTGGRGVHVVGAGVAGMELAWRAAERGHRVVLWEADDTVGGQVRKLAELPGLAEYGDLVDFQERQLARFAVDVRLGQRVTPDMRLAGADTVCVATGAVAQPAPAALPADTVEYPTSIAWSAVAAREPGHACVFDEDGGYYAYGPALRLADLGWRVTLVTSRTDLGAKLDHLSKLGLQRDVRSRGVDVVTGYAVRRVEGGELVLADAFTGGERRMPAPALCVWAGARVAVDGLWRVQAGNAGPVARPVGDALAPRDVMSAIHEGAATAAALQARPDHS